MTDIVEKLMAASVGHPFAKIPWPHRVLHEAADEITKLRAALKEIRDTGPMTLDDQRWRIALVALGSDK
jgi:hypothetical protein